VSDSNADELPFGALSTHTLEPTSSLSLVSSGYGTATSSEKSRWSQAEVQSSLRQLLYLLTRSPWLPAVHAACLSGYRVAQ